MRVVGIVMMVSGALILTWIYGNPLGVSKPASGGGVTSSPFDVERP